MSQTVDQSPGPSPRPSAVRMRRLRERRRNAAERQTAETVRVSFDLAPDGIALLVELGWLAAADQQDRPAQERAFERFVNAAASAGIRPITASEPALAPSPPTKPPQPEWLAGMFREWEDRVRALPPSVVSTDPSTPDRGDAA